METKCRGEVSEKDVIIGTLQDELTTVKSDFETNKRELEELKSSQVVTSAQEDEALKSLRSEMDQIKKTHSDEIDIAYKEIEELRASLEQAIDETNVATEKLFDEQYEHQQKVNQVELEKKSITDDLQAQLRECKKEVERLTVSLSGGTDATEALGEAL